MATTMLCPSWSVLRLQSNIITNEQTTQLAKRPICPRPPERLGALVSAFLSAAPLLTRSNIHRRDSLPAVSCNAGFCNAPEARCLTSTMLMALQKPHRSANRGALPHLIGEWFKSAAAIDIVHVPYRGGGPFINDLVAGQVQMTFEGTSVLLPLIQSGKLYEIS